MFGFRTDTPECAIDLNDAICEDLGPAVPPEWLATERRSGDRSVAMELEYQRAQAAEGMRVAGRAGQPRWAASTSPQRDSVGTDSLAPGRRARRELSP